MLNKRPNYGVLGIKGHSSLLFYIKMNVERCHKTQENKSCISEIGRHEKLWSSSLSCILKLSFIFRDPILLTTVIRILCHYARFVNLNHYLIWSDFWQSGTPSKIDTCEKHSRNKFSKNVTLIKQKNLPD